MNLERLRIKYNVSNKFSSDTNSISYGDSIKFGMDAIFIDEECISKELIKYILFDKTSYLKLNRAELRGEKFNFFVKIIYSKNKEMKFRIFSSDDWVVIQEILRQMNIVVHTPNSLKA